ncbi:MAG: glycosyltransferase family 2 protein [Pyrinomonadaceae bacterium]
MNKVSIALCTYNGEKFLREQLESFTRQIHLPDELIICDDGSSDATAEIAEEFAQTAPLSVAVHVNETNLGSTKNFEKAIALCTGDYVFLSDQDDVWLPEKTGRFLAEFEKSEKVGMVFADAELVGENLEPLKHNLWEFSFTPDERRQAKNGRMFEVLLRKNVVTGATMAFRAEFQEMFSPIPIDVPNTIHDAWIALVIAANAEVRLLEKPLILYRQHAGQQLGIDWRYKEKLGKISRRERYEKSICFQRMELERLEKLAEITRHFPQFQKKASEIPIDALIKSYAAENDERIRHYEARKNLASNKLRRVSPVIKEFSTGRYRRFSKNLRSAAKDLFENW